VLIFFYELGLPFETEFVEMENVKKEPYTNVNPNGRLPSIHDPNTGVTLWEVGMISVG
jgi:glutathione S-transferase